MPSVGVEFDGELVACLNDTPLSAQQSYEECAHFPHSAYSSCAVITWAVIHGLILCLFCVSKVAPSGFPPLKCTLHLTLNVKRIPLMYKICCYGSCCAPGCFA